MRIDPIVADPAPLLARALIASSIAAGCDATVTAQDSRPWASATYIGARHVVTLSSPACVTRYRWLAALTDIELPVRGHIALPPAILRADDDTVVLEVVALENH